MEDGIYYELQNENARLREEIKGLREENERLKNESLETSSFNYNDVVYFPRLCFGYQLFDKVSLAGNKVGFIYGRRLRGSFDIRDIFGNRIKEISYKKIKLIKSRENIIKEVVTPLIDKAISSCVTI